jgi:ATPase subunit of ABC transporter with duplicated ATPase domains
MGQNGAGKSTIFELINSKIGPRTWQVHKGAGLSIATAKQVIPREDLKLTVREFFEKCFSQKVYDIDPRIEAVLEVVHLSAPFDRLVGSFSGANKRDYC